MKQEAVDRFFQHMADTLGDGPCAVCGAVVSLQPSATPETRGAWYREKLTAADGTVSPGREFWTHPRCYDDDLARAGVMPAKA